MAGDTLVLKDFNIFSYNKVHRLLIGARVDFGQAYYHEAKKGHHFKLRHSNELKFFPIYRSNADLPALPGKVTSRSPHES